MRVRAPAKINPYLTVGPRRPNGLHEIVSVMQAVSLFDAVTLEAADGFSLSVAPPDAAPGGDDNLVMRAARAFAALQGASGGASIGLEKRIPVAAGLAGGSADAAATLVGLNQLWRAGVSRKALERVAARLGSDVPFCVRGGTAAVWGTGEQQSSLPVRAPVWWVLGISGEQLSTAAVYAAFDERGVASLGDPTEVADALARGDLDRLAAALRNDLQASALSLAPSIGSGGGSLMDAGALAALVSGSGPTWIGLARDEQHAQDVATRASAAFTRVEVVSSLTHGPRVEV